MEIACTGSARTTLAFEMLADMILSFTAKKERRTAPPEVREAILTLMDKDSEEQLDSEMTAELLNTTDYRLIA